MNVRTILSGLAIAGTSVTLVAIPAGAEHDHYLLTPNGECHQLAFGQTSISDPEHGGYHRFHANVHLGATESDVAPDNLGDGNAAVAVYKAGPAPAVCDGD